MRTGSSNCTNGAPSSNVAARRPHQGHPGWLNTPDGAPVDLKSLRGKVVLIDFWAYSCINCQRAIPHVVDWYDDYRDMGLEVIGVHCPEYAFEKDAANVASGAESWASPTRSRSTTASRRGPTTATATGPPTT